MKEQGDISLAKRRSNDEKFAAVQPPNKKRRLDPKRPRDDGNRYVDLMPKNKKSNVSIPQHAFVKVRRFASRREHIVNEEVQGAPDERNSVLGKRIFSEEFAQEPTRPCKPRRPTDLDKLKHGLFNNTLDYGSLLNNVDFNWFETENDENKKPIYWLLEQMAFADPESETSKNALILFSMLGDLPRTIVFSTDEKLTPLCLLCMASIKLNVNLVCYYKDQDIIRMPWDQACMVAGNIIDPINMLLNLSIYYPRLFDSFKTIIKHYREYNHDDRFYLLDRITDYTNRITDESLKHKVHSVIHEIFSENDRTIYDGYNQLSLVFSELSLAKSDHTRINSSEHEESYERYGVDMVTPSGTPRL